MGANSKNSQMGAWNRLKGVETKAEIVTCSPYIKRADQLLKLSYHRLRLT